MYQFPIGVMLESFRLADDREAVAKAAEVGAQGIQMYATSGVHAPENMNAAARREMVDLLASHGLRFSALCGDLGHGFGNAELNPGLIEKSKRILDMSLDMGCGIVTTHIGVVPEDPNHERFKIMQAACYELAEYADSIGARFAVETGPETSAVLKMFLDSLGGTRGVGVNLDPANLVMVTGDDPVQAVYNLKDYIVHTHAKDGVLLKRGNPEFIYGVVHPVPEEYHGVRFFEEKPLGDGNVPFPAYMAALEDIGYKGFLTIERECGATPEADIRKAVNTLSAIMGK